jgi:hypothetical protein
MVVNYRIVPNDRIYLVQQLFKEIYFVSETSKICKVVYTNNPKVDSALIQDTYIQCYPKKIAVDVLLDIFHARERVLKVYGSNILIIDQLNKI